MSTLVIGFICKDGALMASDSQVPTWSAAGPLRLTAPKIKQVGELPILWGGATNDLGFIQKVEERIEAVLRTRRPATLADLRPEVVAIVHHLRKEVLAHHRELYGERDIEATPAADLLFVEYTASSNRILCISKDGGDVWLDNFGYGAVGLGDSFAHKKLWSKKLGPRGC
jgi:hypothetical protein